MFVGVYKCDAHCIVIESVNITNIYSYIIQHTYYRSIVFFLSQ